jgi:hypothetical protein
MLLDFPTDKYIEKNKKKNLTGFPIKFFFIKGN